MSKLRVAGRSDQLAIVWMGIQAAGVGLKTNGVYRAWWELAVKEKTKDNLEEREKPPFQAVPVSRLPSLQTRPMISRGVGKASF